MAKPRVFTATGTQAGVYHLVSRIVDRQFRLDAPEKETFARMMRAFAAFHQVQILTYCLMGNHFHLLVRVPRRPKDFDLPFEKLWLLWQKAVGRTWHTNLHRQFEIFRTSGSEAGIEQWRQRMLGRMFSLTEFMKALKQRFTQWYNRTHDRTGTLWEGRYKSLIVQDEERALRIMATYIDLNPVRAGLTGDPASHRWSGYAEAMAGNRDALEGLARITGATAERVLGQAPGTPAPSETSAQRKRRHHRALLHYRQMLGLAGRERVREDGTVTRRGLSEKVQKSLANESAPAIQRELLLKRVKHFTRGVILGSREFIDDWFERHRPWFAGRSATTRETGARPISKEWRGLYNLRQLRP
ncbi:MAG TPA: transposase [Verrucomicrobiales bacterium]|nr:transposase [Verrucomicrobiales bacterium]